MSPAVSLARGAPSGRGNVPSKRIAVPSLIVMGRIGSLMVDWAWFEPLHRDAQYLTKTHALL